MELHPRISSLDFKLQEKRIILGSFPTWTLTPPDPDKNESIEEKENRRIINNDFNFFYGSSNNHFWDWYKTFVDPNLSKGNIHLIQNSLSQNKIGITDVILQCTRKGDSSLDKHLTNRTYNHSFFQLPLKKQKIKILCTSKGVMNDMLLTSAFFKKHPQLKINIHKSNEQQSQIAVRLKANSIQKPFFIHIESETGGIIECMALPSPGSPYRRLVDFGLNKHNLNEYLNSYLNESFTWFKS